MVTTVTTTAPVYPSTVTQHDITLNAGATCSLWNDLGGVKVSTTPSGVVPMCGRYVGTLCNLESSTACPEDLWYGFSPFRTTCFVEVNVTNSNAAAATFTIYVTSGEMIRAVMNSVVLGAFSAIAYLF